MSDLCMYELQDNIWDEFGETDDHIVPQPTDDAGFQCEAQSEGHKKLKTEVAGLPDDVDSAANFIVLGNKETSVQNLTRKAKMLEKDSWSHAPDGVLPASCDSEMVKNPSGIPSDDSRMSSHCFKGGTSREYFVDDNILSSHDNNLYHYPPNISQKESYLNLFNGEEKESNDLYYGWPDIGNFEDVDKMFRACDSTFALGTLSNDDDLGWFSTSHAVEGSEDALKSGFKFLCAELNIEKSISENEGSSGLYDDSSVSDSKNENANLFEKPSLETTGAAIAVPGHSQIVTSNAKSESKENFAHVREEHLHRKQLMCQSHLDGKRKDRSLENGGSFQHHRCHEKIADVKYQVGSACLVHVEHSDHIDHISESTAQSGSKSENNFPSPSPRVYSFASNQIPAMESSHDAFEAPVLREDNGKGKLHNHQHLQCPLPGNFNNMDVMSPNVICDPVTVLKQVHRNEKEIEDHSEVDGASVVVRADLDSSFAQESSCLSPALDEISLEETSFRQLQRVMEQLDIRTKLCIRDSLFRLAQSAEQRHNSPNPHSVSRNDATQSGLVIAEETNKYHLFVGDQGK